MNSIENKLRSFFFAEGDLRALAICRAGFGLCLFLHYAFLFRMVELLWGPEGFTGSRWRHHVEWATSVGRESVHSFQVPALFADMNIVWGLYALLVISSLAFTLGLRPRMTGAVALVLHCLFHSQNEFIFWGWAAIIKPLMLYVVLSDSGRWYSLDSLLREKRWFPNRAWTGTVWPLRLLQLHITTMYVVVAYARVSDPNWIDGSMLFGILSDSVFSRLALNWSFAQTFIAGLGYGSWGLELAAPFLLWNSRTRRVAVLLLIVLHIGLETLTMVGYWNLLMISALSSFWFFSSRDNR